ncbi:hypothetical protein [Oceanicella actignis]|uniref:hypothetical protein n=1 Tax=Oceanicella actignis TaxID=1189325 RepID=UPI0011E61AF6|nr:hypothetical protein [Oceanicella actignis]TYO85198.1 hypothetical protein LY05_02624 [Oceanicella actignis]
MTLMHVTATKRGLALHAPGRQDRAAPGRALAGRLARALEALPQGAPVAVLVHGYRYSPLAPAADPHALLYDPRRGARWPAALGFSAEDPRDGLCIGFGWPASAGHVRSLLRHGRNGFAQVYRRAAGAGDLLAELLTLVNAIRPDLRCGVFAHSLGARVALRALGAPGVGPVVLLGAAEHASAARAALGAAGAAGAHVVNVISRQNDLFDAMFERFAPAPAGAPGGALGREGLGARRPDWIDLQLDHPAVEAWLAARGVPLGDARAPVCHWSFYARRNAMAFYACILRRPGAWSPAAMRAAGVPEVLAPRWARLAPLRAATAGAGFSVGGLRARAARALGAAGAGRPAEGGALA